MWLKNNKSIKTGHRSGPSGPSQEPSNDWEVSVRGADKNNIAAFVDRVQFELHESFENPHRQVQQPDQRGAYICRASGYAGFLMPIKITFKDGNETRLVVSVRDYYCVYKDAFASFFFYLKNYLKWNFSWSISTMTSSGVARPD